MQNVHLTLAHDDFLSLLSSRLTSSEGAEAIVQLRANFHYKIRLTETVQFFGEHAAETLLCCLEYLPTYKCTQLWPLLEGGDIEEACELAGKISAPQSLSHLYAHVVAFSGEMERYWNKCRLSGHKDESDRYWSFHLCAERGARKILFVLARRIFQGDVDEGVCDEFPQEARTKLRDRIAEMRQEKRYNDNIALLYQAAMSLPCEEFKTLFRQLDYYVVRDSKAINDFLLSWLDVAERDLFAAQVREVAADERIAAFERLQNVSRIVRGHTSYLQQEAAEKQTEQEKKRHKEVLSAIEEVGNKIDRGFDRLDESIRRLQEETRFQGEMTRRFVHASAQALYDKLGSIDNKLASLSFLGAPLVSSSARLESSQGNFLEN